MSRRNAVSIAGFVLWAGLLYLGVTVLTNAARQCVAGFPNDGQLRFYVFFPEAVALASACLIVFANMLPKIYFVILTIGQFALIPCYLFIYTGGI